VRVLACGEEILTRLATVGAGRVVLSTVYDPSEGTGEIVSAGLPAWPQGPTLVRALNTGLSGLATCHGATVADVHAQFLGHGIQAGDVAGTDSRPATRDMWYCGVIEPNAWGAHAIRRTWWNALTDTGWQPDTHATTR
jgi:hypothetical protein